MRGITSLELLIGACTIALLVGGIRWAIGAGGVNDEASLAAERAETILAAAEAWKSEHSTGCPTVSELIRDDRLSSSVSTDDPWGSRYRVRCDEDRLSVWSAGRDGKPRTADDLTVSRS